MTEGTLDRTKLLPRSGVAIVSPWLVVAPPGNRTIRLDLRALDHVRLADADEMDDADEDPRSTLILVCGDLEVALFIADGPDAAARIVEEAAAVTREASDAADRSQLLFVAEDPVLLRGDLIQVGRVAFRVGEVREYALVGANVPLPEGCVLQAAMALLVVAAAERDGSSEAPARTE